MAELSRVQTSSEKNFFQSHALSGITIADPFMGGGTPLVEANRLGWNAIGCDGNQMARLAQKEDK